MHAGKSTRTVLSNGDAADELARVYFQDWLLQSIGDVKGLGSNECARQKTDHFLPAGTAQAASLSP